jgi:hypothetical protein
MPCIGGTTKSDLLLQLVNGEAFSHIDSFSIHFDPCQFDIAGRWYGNDGDWGGGHGSGSITVFEDEEDEHECFEREKEHVWRAQYMQVLAEIMRNPNIRKLRIENLLPRRTSVFDTWVWPEFLGQITHLDLGIFGAECSGWSGSTMPGFTQFMDDFLPKDIMKHLVNLKHLRLEASKLSVFGEGMYGGEPFSTRGRIPTVESLELKNIVLGFTFFRFLEERGDSLRELTLHNCMCLAIIEPQSPDNWPSTEHEEVQWSDIWACVVLRCPAMRTVTFLQDELPPLPPSIEDYIEEDMDLALWRHVVIDPEWGTIEENEDANAEELLLDQACTVYDNMMEVLAERREKDRSSPHAEATETK